MTSACIFKDTLRNHTQVFLEFRDSILRFIYISSTSTSRPTSHLSVTKSSGAGTSKEIPLQESGRLSSAILITLPIFIYWNQLLIQTIFLDQYNHVNYFDGLWWLWCILRGTKFNWTQPTKTQHSKYPQLNRGIGAAHSTDALSVVYSISPTADIYHWRWLQWAYDALWFWTAAPNRSAKLERLEPASQSLQHPGNHGSGRSDGGWQQRWIQPPVTRPVWSIAHLHATHECQYIQ